MDSTRPCSNLGESCQICMTGDGAQEADTGLPYNGTDHGIPTPVTSNAGYYRIEPPFFFFCPPISHAWHEGVPSFLARGGEIEMRLLQREVPKLSTHQEVRANM